MVGAGIEVVAAPASGVRALVDVRGLMVLWVLLVLVNVMMLTIVIVLTATMVLLIIVTMALLMIVTMPRKGWKHACGIEVPCLCVRTRDVES